MFSVLKAVKSVTESIKKKEEKEAIVAPAQVPWTAAFNGNNSSTDQNSFDTRKNFEDAPIDVYQYQENQRTEFLKFISKTGGSSKIIVLDPAISSAIGLIISAQDLKSSGVDAWFELHHDKIPIVNKSQTVMYFCRPVIKVVKTIMSQIEGLACKLTMLISNPREGQKYFSEDTRNCVIPENDGEEVHRRFIIVFIPTRSELCFHTFQSLKPGLWSEIEVLDYPLFFFVVEHDVFSLEFPGCFSSYACHGDPTVLSYVAQAILQIQNLFGASGRLVTSRTPNAAESVVSGVKTHGVFPNIKVIGPAAKYVSEILIKKRQKEIEQSLATRASNDIFDEIHVGKCPDVPPVKFVLHAEQNGFTLPKKNSQTYEDRSSEYKNSIDCAVLFDRSVDLVTPLCSSFTYEALLDQYIGINCSSLKACLNSEGDILEDDGNMEQKTGNYEFKTLIMNNNDVIFKGTRDLHQNELGPYLHKKAQEIKETYKEKDGLESMDIINEFMKKFRVKLKEHGSLSFHVNLASFISSKTKQSDHYERLQLEDKIMQTAGSLSPTTTMRNIVSAFSSTGSSNKRSTTGQILSTIEKMICEQTDIIDILRLVCLFSLLNNGIPGKQLNELRNLIVRQFGFSNMFRLWNLETVGLLRSHGSTFSAQKVFRTVKTNQNWEEIMKQFNLLVDDNEAMMLDISYVCSGYAPLSVRLVQLLHSVEGGWQNCSKALELLLGPAIEIKQQCFHSTPAIKDDDKEKGNPNSTSASIIVLVVFIGGVTYAEIAAIRRLSKLSGGNVQYIIATTDILTPKRLFESFECF